MKASELRIGNWVFNKANERKQLKEIFSDASIYEPIHLTEEWLLKFGFKKERENNGKRYLKGVFETWTGNNWDYFTVYLGGGNWDSNQFTPELKYVHQLQNLYFALTGEELTIE